MSNLPRFLRMKASVKKAETQDADSASTVLTTTRCCWVGGASAPLNEGQNIQRNSVPICRLGEQLWHRGRESNKREQGGREGGRERGRRRRRETEAEGENEIDKREEAGRVRVRAREGKRHRSFNPNKPPPKHQQH